MIQSLTSVLGFHSLPWKPDSLCYMASAHGKHPQLLVDTDVGQLPIPHVDGMLVLGTWLESTGATKPSYEHRPSQAEKLLEITNW